jgi:hypothetical protein
MNKTVNINLRNEMIIPTYFDAIKRSLSNSSGHDEIIKDIEMRVSELLNENW